MNIHPMSEHDYKLWAPRSREGYAQDKMRSGGLTKEEAEKIAADDFQRLLPEGLSSKESFLFCAKDETGARIGFLWFAIRGALNNRRAFVCDILVEEEQRGKGYGRKLMLFAEKEARRHGLKRIGLHVFAFNKTAWGLYESLGYETTDLVMEKSL